MVSSRLKHDFAKVSAVVMAATLAASAQLAAQSRNFQTAWRGAADEWRSLVSGQGVLGSSLAFMANGEVMAFETFGMADKATNRAVDHETIYHWASITKTFTGIAIMQLRDRGLLTLDDPIVHYVPELQDVRNPFGSIETITIRHLLSHSAGFRSPTWPWSGDEEWHPHEPTAWNQLVAMMPYTTIHFQPGDRFSYSNPGIIFLGRVIEKLSGDDWEVYVDKNILTPLGMHRSYFDNTPYHLVQHRSNNYDVRDGEVIANGLDFDTGITVSNGGLNAPIPDMFQYVSFLAGSSDDAVARNVLSRTSLAEMWNEVVPIEGDMDAGIGLTYFILRVAGQRFIGHTGGQKAFTTFFYVHPETRTAAIAAFNTRGVGDPPRPNAGQILTDVRQILFTKVFPVFTGAQTATGAR